MVHAGLVGNISFLLNYPTLNAYFEAICMIVLFDKIVPGKLLSISSFSLMNVAQRKV